MIQNGLAGTPWPSTTYAILRCRLPLAGVVALIARLNVRTNPATKVPAAGHEGGDVTRLISFLLTNNRHSLDVN